MSAKIESRRISTGTSCAVAGRAQNPRPERMSNGNDRVALDIGPPLAVAKTGKKLQPEAAAVPVARV
jgi:hypothetical protein